MFFSRNSIRSFSEDIVGWKRCFEASDPSAQFIHLDQKAAVDDSLEKKKGTKKDAKPTKGGTGNPIEKTFESVLLDKSKPVMVHDDVFEHRHIDMINDPTAPEWCQWLLSQIMLIADNAPFFPDGQFLWNNIFPQLPNGRPIFNPHGRYLVKLFLQGKWRLIEIDDTVPVCKSYLPSLPRSRKDELWPQILCKALLKAFQKELCLNRLDVPIISALTGWVPQKVKMTWSALSTFCYRFPMLAVHMKSDNAYDEATAQQQKLLALKEQQIAETGSFKSGKSITSLRSTGPVGGGAGVTQALKGIGNQINTRAFHLGGDEIFDGNAPPTISSWTTWQVAEVRSATKHVRLVCRGAKPFLAMEGAPERIDTNESIIGVNSEHAIGNPGGQFMGQTNHLMGQRPFSPGSIATSNGKHNVETPSPIKTPGKGFNETPSPEFVHHLQTAALGFGILTGDSANNGTVSIPGSPTGFLQTNTQLLNTNFAQTQAILISNNQNNTTTIVASNREHDSPYVTLGHLKIAPPFNCIARILKGQPPVSQVDLSLPLGNNEDSSASNNNSKGKAVNNKKPANTDSTSPDTQLAWTESVPAVPSIGITYPGGHWVEFSDLVQESEGYFWVFHPPCEMRSFDFEHCLWSERGGAFLDEETAAASSKNQKDNVSTSSLLYPDQTATQPMICMVAIDPSHSKSTSCAAVDAQLKEVLLGGPSGTKNRLRANIVHRKHDDAPLSLRPPPPRILIEVQPCLPNPFSSIGGGDLVGAATHYQRGNEDAAQGFSKEKFFGEFANADDSPFCRSICPVMNPKQTLTWSLESNLACPLADFINPSSWVCPLSSFLPDLSLGGAALTRLMTRLFPDHPASISFKQGNSSNSRPGTSVADKEMNGGGGLQPHVNLLRSSNALFRSTSFDDGTYAPQIPVQLASGPFSTTLSIPFPFGGRSAFVFHSNVRAGGAVYRVHIPKSSCGNETSVKFFPLFEFLNTRFAVASLKNPLPSPEHNQPDQFRVWGRGILKVPASASGGIILLSCGDPSMISNLRLYVGPWNDLAENLPVVLPEKPDFTSDGGTSYLEFQNLRSEAFKENAQAVAQRPLPHSFKEMRMVPMQWLEFDSIAPLRCPRNLKSGESLQISNSSDDEISPKTRQLVFILQALSTKTVQSVPVTLRVVLRRSENGKISEDATELLPLEGAINQNMDLLEITEKLSVLAAENTAEGAQILAQQQQLQGKGNAKPPVDAAAIDALRIQEEDAVQLQLDPLRTIDIVPVSFREVPNTFYSIWRSLVSPNDNHVLLREKFFIPGNTAVDATLRIEARNFPNAYLIARLLIMKPNNPAECLPDPDIPSLFKDENTNEQNNNNNSNNNNLDASSNIVNGKIPKAPLPNVAAATSNNKTTTTNNKSGSNSQANGKDQAIVGLPIPDSSECIIIVDSKEACRIPHVRFLPKMEYILEVCLDPFRGPSNLSQQRLNFLQSRVQEKVEKQFSSTESQLQNSSSNTNNNNAKGKAPDSKSQQSSDEKKAQAIMDASVGWSLTVSASGPVSVGADTTEQEEVNFLLHLWEAQDEGRSARALNARLEFMKKNPQVYEFKDGLHKVVPHSELSAKTGTELRHLLFWKCKRNLYTVFSALTNQNYNNVLKDKHQQQNKSFSLPGSFGFSDFVQCSLFNHANRLALSELSLARTFVLNFCDPAAILAKEAELAAAADAQAGGGKKSSNPGKKGGLDDFASLFAAVNQFFELEILEELSTDVRVAWPLFVATMNGLPVSAFEDAISQNMELQSALSLPLANPDNLLGKGGKAKPKAAPKSKSDPKKTTAGKNSSSSELSDANSNSLPILKHPLLIEDHVTPDHPFALFERSLIPSEASSSSSNVSDNYMTPNDVLTANPRMSKAASPRRLVNLELIASQRRDLMTDKITKLRSKFDETLQSTDQTIDQSILKSKSHLEILSQNIQSNAQFSGAVGNGNTAADSTPVSPSGKKLDAAAQLAQLQASQLSAQLALLPPNIVEAREATMKRRQYLDRLKTILNTEVVTDPKTNQIMGLPSPAELDEVVQAAESCGAAEFDSENLIQTARIRSQLLTIMTEISNLKNMAETSLSLNTMAQAHFAAEQAAAASGKGGGAAAKKVAKSAGAGGNKGNAASADDLAAHVLGFREDGSVILPPLLSDEDVKLLNRRFKEAKALMLDQTKKPVTETEKRRAAALTAELSGSSSSENNKGKGKSGGNAQQSQSQLLPTFNFLVNRTGWLLPYPLLLEFSRARELLAIIQTERIEEVRRRTEHAKAIEAELNHALPLSHIEV